jgi:hypothetical protein
VPRILDLIQMPDGRIGVVLDAPTDDEGNVTLWTSEERNREIKDAVMDEREACALIAEGRTTHEESEWGGGVDAASRDIAHAIRAR